MAAPKNTIAAPARLIGAKRASAEFGIKYTSLRDIVHRGELPFIRIGRAMYFERRDLEQWIESRKERLAS
jgi:excisionase family DNA binding protein